MTAAALPWGTLTRDSRHGYVLTSVVCSFYPDSLIPTVQYVSLGTALQGDAGAYDHDTTSTTPEEDFPLEDPALATVVDFADFVQPFRNAS